MFNYRWAILELSTSFTCRADIPLWKTGSRNFVTSRSASPFLLMEHSAQSVDLKADTIRRVIEMIENARNVACTAPEEDFSAKLVDWIE